MTDTLTPTLAAFTSEQVSTMPPETRGTFARQLAASGFDKVQLEKTFGADSLKPPAPAASPNAKPTTPSKDTLAMAARLKQHWTGDPAALDTALKNAGAEFKPDTRTDAEQAFDAGFPAPESAEDYRLNFTGRTVGDPAALGALNGKYQDMFAAMALPGIAAQGVLDTLLDSAGRFGKLTTDAQRKLYQQEQKILTEKLGKDIGDLKTIVAFAAKALDRVADQAFIKQLTESGAFSAAGILHMARQGQRLAHREQLAAKRSA